MYIIYWTLAEVETIIKEKQYTKALKKEKKKKKNNNNVVGT